MWRLQRSANTNREVIAVCLLVLATATAFPTFAQQDGPRKCTTNLGGQVVCGNLTIGITLEEYEKGLKARAEEIRAEEAVNSLWWNAVANRRSHRRHRLLPPFFLPDGRFHPAYA